MEFMAKVIKANSLYAKEFHKAKIVFFFYMLNMINNLNALICLEETMLND